MRKGESIYLRIFISHKNKEFITYLRHLCNRKKSEKMVIFFLKHFFSNFRIYPVSDLGEEEIEEYRLLSNFTPKQIHKYRLRFLKYVACSDYITREEFMKIPSIVECPLLGRLVAVFGFDEDKPTISFFEYLKVLYQFNGDTEKEDKIELLFRLHDYDGDGRLSRFDLTQFLKSVLVLCKVMYVYCITVLYLFFKL